MIYNALVQAINGRGLFAILIDPDKYSYDDLKRIIKNANYCNVDFFMLGGSLLISNIERTLQQIKSLTNIPVILFPGSPLQFVSGADGIFLLSLISGRNAEFLIGHHILISSALKESNMEIIPTGYMLINDGVPTSVQYMSNTLPIPSTKPEIALATALAGCQLGLKSIYLEAGSGAKYPIPLSTIKLIRKNIDAPIIIGGGLHEAKQVREARESGATMIVVGNALEKNPERLEELVLASR